MHARPQAPQFALVLRLISHPFAPSPSQSAYPSDASVHAVTTHRPAMHAVVAAADVPPPTVAHTRPHAPQLRLSVAVLTQVLLHTVFGASHGAQAVPASTHAIPAGHPPSHGLRHLPPTHRPDTHRFPHAPQFVGSVAAADSHPFEASPSQLAKPEIQPKPQRPPEHKRIPLIRSGQSMPQQLLGSVVEVQTSGAIEASAAETQVPERHASSARHEREHTPQLTGSVLVFEQPLRHIVSPVAHSQAPSDGVRPGPQS